MKFYITEFSKQINSEITVNSLDCSKMYKLHTQVRDLSQYFKMFSNYHIQTTLVTNRLNRM